MDLDYIQRVQRETHQWRMEKWPDLDVWKQFGGFTGEIAEFVEILFKAEFYDDEWYDERRLQEEAGDLIIYFLGVLSLVDLDAKECIEAAMEKNDRRDWDDHQEAPAEADD